MQGILIAGVNSRVKAGVGEFSPDLREVDAPVDMHVGNLSTRKEEARASSKVPESLSTPPHRVSVPVKKFVKLLA